MNPALRILLRGHAHSGPPPAPPGGTLFSVLFPSATTGDAIDITVPVVFDLTDSPNFGKISVKAGGKWIENRYKDTKLNCAGFVCEMGGEEYAGTSANPFPITRKAVRNYTGLRSLENTINPGNLTSPATAVPTWVRGRLGMPGSIRNWWAETPNIVLSPLIADINVGDTSMQVEGDILDWRVGSLVEISTSRYPSEGIGPHGYARERVVITSVSARVPSGTTVGFTRDPDVAGTGAQFFHLGRLQFVVGPSHEGIAGTNLSYTDSGVTSGENLVYGASSIAGNSYLGSRLLAAQAAGSPRIIDERAVVGLLSHPLQITGPVDTDRIEHGWGCGDMQMGGEDTGTIDRTNGVEFSNSGKAGQRGAYGGFHDHMGSYVIAGLPSGGTFLGDLNATNRFRGKWSVRDSSNRAGSIHGVCNLAVTDFVFSNIDTHAVFSEDGSEQRCQVRRGLVSGVNAINTISLDLVAKHGGTHHAKATILNHDKIVDSTVSGTPEYAGPGIADQQTGPAGVWWTNPNNHISDIYVRGAFIGHWNSFGGRAMGQSAFAKNGDGTLIVPYETQILEFARVNVGCVRFRYFLTSPHVDNDAGDVTDLPTRYFADGTSAAFGSGSGYQSGDVYGVYQESLGHPRQQFVDSVAFKSDGSWYQHKIEGADYIRFRMSGLRGLNKTFHGERLGVHGNVGNTTFDGWLTATNTLFDAYPDAPVTQMLTYGNGVNRINGTYIPTKLTSIHFEGDTSHFAAEGGVMSPFDFYIWPVLRLDRSFYANDYNNTFLGKNTGVLGAFLPPPFLAAQFGSQYTALWPGGSYPGGTRQNSGAFKLPPDGSMYGQAGWVTYNSPYMLSGVTGAVAVPGSPAGQPNMIGVLVPATQNYYGLQVTEVGGRDMLRPGDTNPTTSAPAINYERRASDLVTPIANTAGTGVPYATWNTPKAESAFQNMRHAVVPDGGAVFVTFPDATDMPLSQFTSIKCDVQGFDAAYGAPTAAHFFVGFKWNPATSLGAGAGDYPGTQLYNFDPSIGQAWFNAPAVASRAALIASTGLARWVDTTNNEMWLHIVKPHGGTLDWAGNPLDPARGGFRIQINIPF